MSQSSWLVAGVLPGIERQPRKELAECRKLLGLLHRWRDEAVRTGRKITRIAPAFEAGRDGFWLARWRSCSWGGGACDPSLECRRIARTSPGQDRPARHRVAEAGVLGVAGRGTGHCSYLTGKAPCKFEIDLPPAESHERASGRAAAQCSSAPCASRSPGLDYIALATV